MISIYLIYDTQLIIGGKSRQISIDDYIFAAMSLYVDMIRLFMEILKIVSRVRV